MTRRPMVLVDWRDEIRAGRLDARRTPGARVLDGRRYGDVFYTAGYALGVLT